MRYPSMAMGKTDEQYISEAFEWAAGFTNLTGDTLEKIKAAVFDVFLSGDSRKATKSIAPMLDESFFWPAGTRFLAGDPIPSVKELVEDGMTREEALAERKRLKSAVDAGLPLTIGKAKQVAELFVHLAVMKAFALKHHDRHMSCRSTRPFWMFDSINDDMTPKDCRRLDGHIARWDDEFWRVHPIPCGRAFCRCTIRSLSPEQAEERKRSKR